MQKRRSRRSGVEFVRFYPGAWRNGCTLLSLEEEALYLRICAFRWDTGCMVPSDRSAAAKLLRVQILKYRKLIDGLIAQGLVEETDDGLVVERAELEFRNASAGAAGNAAETFERPAREVDPRQVRETRDDTLNRGGNLDYTPHHTPTHTPHHTTPVEAEKTEQNQLPVSITKNKTKNNIINNSATHLEPAAAQPSDDDLEKSLIEACAGALDNPVNCLGLLNLQVPKMWLAKGADLQSVVLPTLRAAGRKYAGKRVRDWSYFTPMVVEAQARQARGLPDAPIERDGDIPPWKAERLRKTREFIAICREGASA